MRKIELGQGAFGELRAEALGTPQARRLHRIHAVLLVAGGLSCRSAARLLGDSPRAVEYWVSRYNTNKINGLLESSSTGRPARLSAVQREELRKTVTRTPPGGARGWTGAAVSEFVARRWGVSLGRRQAQRLMADLNKNE